jgi:hypothetical protein
MPRVPTADCQITSNASGSPPAVSVYARSPSGRVAEVATAGLLPTCLERKARYVLGSNAGARGRFPAQAKFPSGSDQVPCEPKISS